MITEDILLNNINQSFKLKEYKNKILLYSGGCDSTLALYELCLDLHNSIDYHIKENIYYDSSYHIITTYAFVHDQLGSKKDKEKEKRTEFLEYCKVAFPRITINHKDINILQNGDINGRFCPQPALWTSNLLPMLNDNSLIYSGYHDGDCFFVYEIFSNWLKIYIGLCNLYGLKNVWPVFPLKYSKKYEIIQKLKSYDLLKYCWHCETPTIDGRECGNCEPCILHKMSKLYLDYLDNCKPMSLTETIKNEPKDLEKWAQEKINEF